MFLHAPPNSFPSPLSFVFTLSSQPLFGLETRGSVEQLLQVIVQALGTTQSLLPKPPPKARDDGGNVFHKFLAAAFGLFSSAGGNLH